MGGMKFVLLSFFVLFGNLAAIDLTDRYPEILWLADDNVRKTEEGRGTSKFVEYDRTMLSLRCLGLILDGSDAAYEEFSGAQPADERLLRNSFNILHLLGKAILKSGWGGLSESEMLQAMETALVLGDIGKSEKARLIFGPFGIRAPDHDDFYGQVMRRGVADICPSFIMLPKSAKELLVKGANLAHYGHIFHLEGGPSMFSQLRKSELAIKDPFVLTFELFIQICDVAGAHGHINSKSSLTYREKTHQGYLSVHRAIGTLSDPEKTELDAYNVHLSQIAQWLGLDPNNRVDRVLARIGAMLRLYTPEKGKILQQAMGELDADVLEKVIAQFDLQQGEEFLRTPTYVPAVLLNLAQKNGLNEAITTGLPFIAKVLQYHREQIANGHFDPNIPLNFNPIAGWVKTSSQRLGDFSIDEEGHVLSSD